MKLNIKEIVAAAAVFACSLIFCCAVLCSSLVYGEEGEDSTDKKKETLKAAAGSAKGRPVIVIDPGHGGMDGGASASDGTLEKDINLQIALRLKELAEEYPVDIIMTRESDISLHSDEEASIRNKKRQDLLKRKEIIDRAQGTLSVSIHLNSFPEDGSVYGAQVFYPDDDVKRTDGRTEEQTSRAYAESIQKSIEMKLPDGRERSVMTKDDFLIFDNPTCPTVLVECGFLSNKAESEKLKTTEYQEEMAYAVWEGINEVLGLEKEQKSEIIDSANRRGKE